MLSSFGQKKYFKLFCFIFQTLEHVALFFAVKMCLDVLVLPFIGILLIATS